MKYTRYTSPFRGRSASKASRVGVTATISCAATPTRPPVASLPAVDLPLERGRYCGLTIEVACAMLFAAVACPAAGDALRPYRIVADAIPDSLTGMTGDVERGRGIVVNRQVGLCLLCHSGPYLQERFQGTLAPDLAGTGSRWSEGQLRLRIVDAGRLSPDTIMPHIIGWTVSSGSLLLSPGKPS